MVEQRKKRERRSGKDRRGGADRRDPDRLELEWQGKADRRNGTGRRLRVRRSGVDRRGYSPLILAPDDRQKESLEDRSPIEGKPRKKKR